MPSIAWSVSAKRCATRSTPGGRRSRLAARPQSTPDWVDRYGPRIDDYRLPESQADRQAYAELIGADGRALLTALTAPTAPRWLREVPAVETLRQVWVQNYTWHAEQLAWRDATMHSAS